MGGSNTYRAWLTLTGAAALALPAITAVLMTSWPVTVRVLSTAAVLIVLAAVGALQFSNRPLNFSDIVRNHPAIMLLIDPASGRIEDANQAALNYYGYSIEQMTSLNIQDINILSADEVHAAMKRAKNHKQVFFEFRHRTAAGTENEVEVYTSLVNINGRRLLLSVIYDASSSKYIAESLAQNEQRLNSLYEFAPVGFALNRLRDGIFLETNQAMCDIAGYSLEELRSIKHTDLLEQESRIRMHGLIKTMLRSGKYGPFEATYIQKDGSRVRARLHGALVKGSDDQRLVWSIVENVTEWYEFLDELSRSRLDLKKSNEQLEQAVSKANELAERASRANEAKDVFIANISHEIRTPVSVILGYADILRSSGTISFTDQVRMLDAVAQGAEHLLSIVNDILDISTIESGHLKLNTSDLNTKELLSSIEFFMSARAFEKDLHFTVSIEGDVPSVFITDHTRVRQVLINLVGNAIKFTDSGRIALNMKYMKQESGHFITFIVSDSGPGIPKEYHDRLFQPFTQIDSSITRKHGGTGLGLAISRRFAKALGGDLYLRESDSQGSTFVFTVPVSLPDSYEWIQHTGPHVHEPEEPEPGSDEPQDRSATGKILLVEDAQDLRLLITRQLSDLPVSVESAADGEEGMKYIMNSLKNKEPYDLVITDIQMPVMDGYTMTRKVREAGYGGPVLALSAHAMKSDREKSLQAGCNDHITKPVKKKQLLAACKKWLSEKPDKISQT